MDASRVLAVEVSQIARRWRIRLDERLKPVGLTKAASVVLFWLSRAPDGMTQTELAEQIGVETSTLTRQLDSMEARGLIERRGVATDRRVKRVVLTERALPLVNQIDAIDAGLRAELFDGLSTDEVHAAVSVLQKLRSRLA